MLAEFQCHDPLCPRRCGSPGHWLLREVVSHRLFWRLPHCIVRDVGVGSSANTTVHIVNAGDAVLNIDSIRLRGVTQQCLHHRLTGPFAPWPRETLLRLPSGFHRDTRHAGFSALIVNSDAASNLIPWCVGREGTPCPGESGWHSWRVAAQSAALPQGFTADRAVLFYRPAAGPGSIRLSPAIRTNIFRPLSR